MQTLSYGYQVPDNGDLAVNPSGTGWYAQLVYSVTRLNNHSHNGVDSSLLNIFNLTTPSVVAPAASWVANGSGYKQSVTLPAGIGDINNFIPKFYVSTVGARFGNELYLTYVRTGTGNTMDVYIADNTVDVTAIFR